MKVSESLRLGREFLSWVNEHPELEWQGIREGRTSDRGELLVSHVKSGIWVALPWSSTPHLMDPVPVKTKCTNWEQFLDCMRGKRPFSNMSWMSRILHNG